MKQPRSVTILGAGYVGLTTAALLSLSGYKVYVVEPNPKRLEVIKSGKSFFFEEGIDLIIKEGLDGGTLIPTDSYRMSVPGSDVVFGCVGTPDNPDGSSNLSYVFSSAEEAIKHMKNGSVFVQKSTVPVGTGRKIIELFSATKNKVYYVSNPEFLREGTAVYDTLFFDRVVVGGDDKNSVQTIIEVYKNLEKHRSEIAAIGNIKENPRKGDYVATSLNSAELIKVTANAFLALKISFANSIAKLADAADADIVEVMDAVGADERIDRAFLNAGRGYGGGCFPKDVSGLIASADEYAVDMSIMKAAQSVNESMPMYVINKLGGSLPGGSVKGKTVAVLGLAFKAGTSDVRKSPGVAIANQLSELGATVNAYDPEANHEASEDLSNEIRLFDNAENAIKGADATIITTEWPELAKLDATMLLDTMKGQILVDAVNRYPRQTAEKAGLTYIGVGR